MITRMLNLPLDAVVGPEAMQDLGARLAAQLGPGDVLALQGDLGTGKTTLVRGLVQAMGVDPGEAASPTFALAHLYRGGDVTVVHADLYRVEDPDEIEAAGLLEQLHDPEALTIVEWPWLARDLLPRHTIWLLLKMADGGRRVTQTDGPVPVGDETPFR